MRGDAALQGNLLVQPVHGALQHPSLHLPTLLPLPHGGDHVQLSSTPSTNSLEKGSYPAQFNITILVYNATDKVRMKGREGERKRSTVKVSLEPEWWYNTVSDFDESRHIMIHLKGLSLV